MMRQYEGSWLLSEICINNYMHTHTGKRAHVGACVCAMTSHAWVRVCFTGEGYVNITV